MKYSEEVINDIRTYLKYSQDSFTGLYWKTKTLNYKHNVGEVAGYFENNGYARVVVNGKRYSVTHCIMLLHDQVLEETDTVDHIDGNSFNNKIDNLRIVKHAINMRNKKLSSRNCSGMPGVAVLHSTNRVATYYNEENKQKVKYFSITKNGLEKALQLAVEFRLSKIEELNSEGYGYTQRHISERK